jgi:DME family drug/metabolite transporter
MVAVEGVALAALAACGLAGQTLTIRLATQRGATVDVLFVVILVNITIYVPLTILLAPNFSVTPTGILAFVAAGVTGTILGRAFFYSGIKRIGASRADPIKASMPLYATVLAVLVLGEHIPTEQFSGIFLIIGGIALITWEGSADDRETSAGIPWTGLAFPLAGAFFYALEPVFASVGFGEEISILVGLSIKSISAFVIYYLYLRWRHTLPRLHEIPSTDFLWYILAGLFNTGFLLAYYAGLTVSSVGVVVPIMQTSPLIVIGISALFLRDIETVTPRILAAACIIIMGSVIVTLTG